TLQLTAKGIALVKAAVQTVTATADPGLRKDVQHSLEIFGQAAIGEIELIDTPDPVEVGKKVLYVLKFANTGTLPANDVEVKAQIPAEMKLTGAQPQATVQGQAVTFGKVTLQPKQAVEYRIEVEALRAGDARLRVQITSPSLDGGPIAREEPTRIFDAA